MPEEKTKLPSDAACDRLIDSFITIEDVADGRCDMVRRMRQAIRDWIETEEV